MFMRKVTMLGWLLGLALWAQADTGFVPTLPPEVFVEAGLQKLTPAELARLEAAVQNYKAGNNPEVQPAHQVAAVAAQQEAEQKVAVAETKAKEAEEKAVAAEAKAREAELKIAAAETKAREAEAQAREAATKSTATAKSPVTETKVAASPDKKEPGWFKALITLNKAGAKPGKEQPLESRLVGDFSGWSGHTTFTLENGSRWTQQDSSDITPYSPKLHAPKVKIKPAAMNGFWLEIEGVGNRVRVIPVALPEPQ
jgi:hypothetical protein